MPKKRKRDNNNSDRRDKYQYVRSLGFSKQQADMAKSWGWDHLKAVYGEKPPEIVSTPQQKNTERREKYQFVVRLGLGKTEADRAKSWSWDRIKATYAGITKGDATSLLKRQLKGRTYEEQRAEKRQYLIDAGFSKAEANRLKSQPADYLETLIAAKRRLPAGVSWTYQPFDKNYLWLSSEKRPMYAYTVTCKVEGPAGIEEKHITILNDKPLSPGEVGARAEDVINSGGTRREKYNFKFISVLSVVPMAKELPDEPTRKRRLATGSEGAGHRENISQPAPAKTRKRA
jgi:hypothetical protein